MRLWPLFKRDVIRSRRRLFGAMLAVMVSVTIIVVLGGLAFGGYRYVVKPLLPQLPLDVLKVEPRTMSLGLFAFDASALTGGLDDDAVTRLSAVDGVQAVYPVVAAGFPLRAEGGKGFLGRRLRTDVFATGVAPGLNLGGNLFCPGGHVLSDEIPHHEDGVCNIEVIPASAHHEHRRHPQRRVEVPHPIDRIRYSEIQDTFCRVTDGRVAEIVVEEPTSEGYTLGFRLFDGTLVPAQDLSQGLLAYLFYLCVAIRSDRPAIILIEEPENGLHPHRLYEVVQVLRRLPEAGVQVLLTTHSPDLLDACRPEEVLVLLRPDPESGTEIHRLPENFDRIRMRETLGSIWATRGEAGLLDQLPQPTPSIEVESESSS